LAWLARAADFGATGQEEPTVQLEIRIGNGTVDDYAALTNHLNGSRDFRGRVRQVTGPPTDGKLDAGLIEMLTVAVGSGGLGVALTTSLNKWLENRRPDVTVELTVTPKKRTVVLHARNANAKTLDLLRDLLIDDDDDDA
jgi:hypothetical protein